MSDRTWHPRWGRRRPFFLVGAIDCSIILFLFPFVSALWMAVLALWLLDAANNTAMEPYRAFISDMLPKSQLARGFLTQSMFVGFGAVAANGGAQEGELLGSVPAAVVRNAVCNVLIIQTTDDPSGRHTQ